VIGFCVGVVSLAIGIDLLSDMADDDDAFCEREIKACRRLCDNAQSDPDMTNIYGGSTRACMKGCVPSKCGGNMY